MLRYIRSFFPPPPHTHTWKLEMAGWRHGLPGLERDCCTTCFARRYVTRVSTTIEDNDGWHNTPPVWE